MGMFDYLKCEYPIPDGQDILFQTKDTDAQFMENYTITSDGKLIHHTVGYEDTPKDELPYPNAEPGTLESICGIMRSVPTGDVEIPYHGDIWFYTQHDTLGWIEYQARFTNGSVEWIHRVEDGGKPGPVEGGGDA